MAAPKSRAKPAVAVVVAESAPQRMWITPRIAPDMTFAVLRRNLFEVENNLVEFGWMKLHPIVPPGVCFENVKGCWEPTAARWEVVLPAGAADMMSDPRTLLETFERQAAAGQKDLAVVLKLSFPDTRSLHEPWERSRAFAKELFVDQHGLAALLILHVPALSGAKSPAPPHIHVIVPAKVLVPFGFGSFCDLLCDAAQCEIADAWKATS